MTRLPPRTWPSDAECTVLTHPLLCGSFNLWYGFSWEETFHEGFNAKDVTTFNSLFLSFFVVHEDYSAHATAELIRCVSFLYPSHAPAERQLPNPVRLRRLRLSPHAKLTTEPPARICSTLFVAVPDLQNCLLAPLEPLEETSPLAHYFAPLQVIDGDKCPVHVYRALANTPDLFPNLHVRIAAPEDFDDLVPIFNSQSAVLQERYGSDEFFLAELIEAQDDNNKCLVMEVDGTAVGFMSITKEMDTALLTECYDLEPWNQLQQASIEVRERVIEPEPEPEPTAEELAAKVEAEAAAAKDAKKGPAAKSSKVGEAKRTSGANSMGKKDSKKKKGAAAAEEEKPKPKRKPNVVKEEFTVWHKSSFAIAMLCIDEDYEARSLDFMAEAFAQFPDKQYCVVTLPHICREPPLLTNFSRAIPKPRAGPPQELYIMHRLSMFTDITVREATRRTPPTSRPVLRTLRTTS